MDAIEIAWLAADPAIVTDERNRVLGWNKAAEGLFGLSKPEALGHRLHSVLSATDSSGTSLRGDHLTFRDIVSRANAERSLSFHVRTVSGDRIGISASLVIVAGAQPSSYRLVYLLSPSEQIQIQDPGGENRPAILHLTRRQIEVLQQMARGRSADEISRILGVSIHTIRTHIRNIFDSLGVRSQLQAVSMARRWGLVDAATNRRS